MDKENIEFDDTETEEFHQYKSSISINDRDINEIVVSNRFPFDKKDFKYQEKTVERASPSKILSLRGRDC